MNVIRPTTVLITGGTGFVGSHLARRLVAMGCEVHLVIRPTSELEVIHDIIGSVQLHRHDGTTAGLLNIVEQASPKIVFHLASLFIAQHDSSDIENLIDSNLLFATQLLEAMASCHVFKLVNTGTAWQHFNQTQDYSPVCLYAATKQAFEMILTFYFESTPLKAITLKLGDTYGPSDPRKKLFYLLKQSALKGLPLEMSPGEQLIDLVHIDDVVNAFIVAAKRLLENQVDCHETYSVTSQKMYKLKELVELYMTITGKQFSICWGGRSYRKREVMVPWQGRRLIGWQPHIDLVTGLRTLL